MVRRSIVLATLAVVLFSAATAVAQVSSPDTEPAQGGRTPRVPRDPSSEEIESTVVATPLPPPPPAAQAGEAGSTPPAPSGIARSRVRSHVDTDQRAIALTLDDGYRPDHRILDLIARYGVHGTAFIVGDVADSDHMFVRELVRLGWMVCSHTQSHAQLTTLSHAQIRQEMLDGIESVESVVGYRCPYFRAPYGSVDARVAAMADALGVQLIGWDASISDTAPAGTDPDLQTRIATDAIRPGSILLGHFGGTNSYTVLSEVLEWLRTSGYSVGSVAELIDGNTRLLPEIPQLPNVQAVAEALPPVATIPTPMGLSSTEATFYAVAAAFLLSLTWRRLVGRRYARLPSHAAPTLEPL